MLFSLPSVPTAFITVLVPSCGFRWLWFYLCLVWSLVIHTVLALDESRSHTLSNESLILEFQASLPVYDAREVLSDTSCPFSRYICLRIVIFERSTPARLILTIHSRLESGDFDDLRAWDTNTCSLLCCALAVCGCWTQADSAGISLVEVFAPTGHWRRCICINSLEIVL